MAWIISRAMASKLERFPFAQGQGADCSDPKFLESKQSAQSSSNPIVRGYYVSDKTKAHSRYSRFGIMLRPLMEGLGEAMLTLSQQDSHVRTSLHVINIEQESLEQKVPFSLTFAESFAKLSPDGCFWKTPHCLPGLDSTLCLENWPRWGTMRNGECWQRPPLEHLISEKGSGDYLGRLPTPIASSAFYYDTPGARRRINPGYGVLLGGIPNPEWIEWLMGWPIGWTALEPLEMDKSLAVWRRLFCNYHLDLQRLAIEDEEIVEVESEHPIVWVRDFDLVEGGLKYKDVEFDSAEDEAFLIEEELESELVREHVELEESIESKVIEDISIKRSKLAGKEKFVQCSLFE